MTHRLPSACIKEGVGGAFLNSYHPPQPSVSLSHFHHLLRPSPEPPSLQLPAPAITAARALSRCRRPEPHQPPLAVRALIQCPFHSSVPQCPGPLPASPGSSVSRVLAARSSVISRELWFSRVRSPDRARTLVHLGRLSPGPACPCALPCPAFESFQITVMVRTRGGSRLRPRVRFSTLEQEEQAPVPDPVPAPVPEVVPEEPQGFRRYQTRMGPRASSPVPQRRSRRARPSKRARTSEPGESSSSRPEPSPSATEATSSPQLSPASRIRRPLFVGYPIPRKVRLHSTDFHGESYYDVPALTADPRFRDSMRLIEHYSLLPFMTPRQFYYPRVVLQFYHSMTSRGALSPLELRFSIDDRPGVLRAADISAALGLQTVQANSGGYRDWPQPTQWETARILARDTTARPVLFRRQLPPQMLLIEHLLRTSLFPLQHYVQRRGAILEALYRILEGLWFSPSELVIRATVG